MFHRVLRYTDNTQCRFYILGLLFVGLLIRSDDPRLLGSGKSGPSSGDVSASPFVLIGEYAHLYGFNHFINVIIVVSVMSIGVSGVYGGSRTLTALAQKGYAPNCFTYIDRAGRPTFSVGLIIVCGLLAYINLDATGEMVFNWLLALSGLAALFTWGSICLAHIRFRKAWAYHGHTLDEIPFKAIGGVYGSWVGLILCVLVLIASVSIAHQLKDGFSRFADSLPRNSFTAPFSLLDRTEQALQRTSLWPCLHYRWSWSSG